MAQADRKARVEVLSKQLHSGLTDYGVKAVLELLQLRLEGVKNAMLTCKAEEFLKHQGEASAYDKIIRDITRPAPNKMKSAEEK